MALSASGLWRPPLRPTNLQVPGGRLQHCPDAARLLSPLLGASQGAAQEAKRDRCQLVNGSASSRVLGSGGRSGRGKVFRCPACLTDVADEKAARGGKKVTKVKVKLVRKKKGGEDREEGGGGLGGDRRTEGEGTTWTAGARDKNGRSSSGESLTDGVTSKAGEGQREEGTGRKGQKSATAVQGQGEARLDMGVMPTMEQKQVPLLREESGRESKAGKRAETGPQRDAEQREWDRRGETKAGATDESKSGEGSRNARTGGSHDKRLAEEDEQVGSRVTAAVSAASDEEALALLQQVDGFLPLKTVNNCFHALVLKDYWRAASHLLRRMQQQSWWMDRPAIYIQLLFCLARARQPQAAEDLVLAMQAEGRPLHTDLLTALIKAYVSGGWLAKACALLDSMRSSEDCPPSQLTYNLLLKGLVDAREAAAVALLFQEMVDKGMSTTISYNMMIHFQSHRGEEGCAAITAVTERMRQLGVTADVGTYNSMIHAYLSAGKLEEAIRTLYAKHRAGCAVQQPVYSSIIKALMYNRKWDAAELLYEDMEALGCVPDKVIHYLFINGYAKAGRLDRMMQAFDRMCARGCRTAVQTYEKMVDALIAAKQLDSAMALFHCMVADGYQGSPFLYNLLIKACGDNGKEAEAEELFEHMKKEGCPPNLVNYNTMLNVYAKAKMVEKMEALVEEMKAAGFSPDAFTFTTRMGGHKLVGDWKMVESIFEEMQRHGYSPNFRSLATLSGAYRENQQYDKMHQVQEKLEAQGYTRDEKDKRWTLAMKS